VKFSNRYLNGTAEDTQRGDRLTSVNQ